MPVRSTAAALLTVLAAAALLATALSPITVTLLLITLALLLRNVVPAADRAATARRYGWLVTITDAYGAGKEPPSGRPSPLLRWPPESAQLPLHRPGPPGRTP